MTTGPEPPQETSEAKSPGLTRFALLVPDFTVFISGFCVMVIELVAGRIVSRHLGSSIYTWTSVIGVVLAGLAMGNYAGGLLADRFRPRRTLSILFGVSAALCASIVLLDSLVGEWTLLYRLAWPLRVALHVAVIFFLPTLMLGTISPVVAKMALERGQQTGRTLGNIYAWGVLGSIAGTFLTGYLLIAVLGTRAIVWLVAGTLAVMAAGYAPCRRRGALWLVAMASLVVLGNAPWSWARAAAEAIALRPVPDATAIFQQESRYARITVRRDLIFPDRRLLFLDKLLHSQVLMSDPGNLQYDYERIFAAVTRRLLGRNPRPATLMIGGGGYVFPRFLEAGWPEGECEVVEIDPVVTAAARAAFGLAADSRIRVHHEDGRVFINREARRVRSGQAPPYDLVYADAFSDYTVPYQVATIEFYEGIRSLLREGGACLVNVIDLYQNGRFLAALIATLQATFPHVAILAERAPWEDRRGRRSTFVLVCTFSPINAEDLGAEYRPGYVISRLPETEIRRLFKRVLPSPLTDDFAPVEQLLAATVRASALEVAANSLLWRAVRHALAHRIDACAAICREVLDLEPGSYQAHHMLANTFAQKGDLDQAIVHWRETIRSNPDFPEAHYNLGAALCQTNHLAEGMRELHETLRLRPDDVLALNSLGQALEQVGRYDEAIRHYEQALETRPDFTLAQDNLKRARARNRR